MNYYKAKSIISILEKKKKRYVLDLIEDGFTSIDTLSRRSGLSRQVVMNLMNDLIMYDIIQDIGRNEVRYRIDRKRIQEINRAINKIINGH